MQPQIKFTIFFLKHSLPITSRKVYISIANSQVEIIAVTMELKHVKLTKDLKVLEEMDWHDSEAVTGLITRFHQDEFPMTINYSGHDYPNVHLLCKIYSGPAQYLELVFVAVEKMNIRYLNDIFISGRVNELSNVIIVAPNGKEEIIRAAALLYRFLDLNDEDVINYYRKEKKSEEP